MENTSLKGVIDYPEISFIKNYTMEKLADDMVSWFKEKYKELTGKDIVLGKADERRIILLAGAYFIYQGYMYMDDAGKMGLLKYSRGEYLENLGAIKHIHRKPAAGSTTTIRFAMKSKRTSAIGIPKGTRVTAGDNVYFATDEYSEIPAGSLSVDIPATCTSVGQMTNNYDIGDLNTLVDIIAFIDEAKNITKPEGGADIESDESLRQRIYMAPAAYSSAGSADSYEYFVRQFYTGVSSVRITSPSPRVVRVRYLLENGAIPESESIARLKEYLSSPSIKPLTDSIEVLAPVKKTYSINITYYVNSSDQSRAANIQLNVVAAINDYINWQKSEIGRDINPDVLRQKILNAGAKRVDITSPVFTIVDEDSVASLEAQSVTYGGLEND
ncbi:baseplate J/gp47 family protein [Lachnoanaerobaculum sp. JCM 36186]|uniref:baseplate assembly protein n=1 Tax=Lachnoanaerobaculum sanguinis TaxID=3065809 RepID=UPI00276BC62D|nr:baseplate J/gp47 family protein [Lachnoanaerobaculum sp. JCM 36186]GMO03639.1 baseplate J/gp47 family protein [Lachnoanaerobaculum sp. JCM 36186]